MSETSKATGLLKYFERAVLVAAQALIVIVIAIAMADLTYLLWAHVRERLGQVGSIADLTVAVQGSFAGILLIVLGLELLETLRIYRNEHHVRLEVILVVAIIAVGRQVIQLDFEHSSNSTLLGIAALTLALTGGYFLVKRQ